MQKWKIKAFYEGKQQAKSMIDTYTHRDWLQDNGVIVEEDPDCKDFYWVLDDTEEERTGAAYMVLQSLV